MGPESIKPPGTSGSSDRAPAEENIRNQLESRLGSDLEALPLERKAQLVREVTTMVAMSGPLPPPAIAREYEEICPGFVDRSLRMAEKAQDAAIDDVRDTRRKNQFYRLFGMVCAAVLSLSLICAGVLIAIYANILAGTITALVSFIGSVAVAFIKGRPLNDQPPIVHATKDKNESRAGRNSNSTAQKKRRR